MKKPGLHKTKISPSHPDGEVFYVSKDQKVVVHGTDFDTSKDAGGHYKIKVDLVKSEGGVAQAPSKAPKIDQVTAAQIDLTVLKDSFSHRAEERRAPHHPKGPPPPSSGLTVTVTNSDHTSDTNPYPMTYAT